MAFPLIQAACTALLASPVQPFKAAGLSAGGRPTRGPPERGVTSPARRRRPHPTFRSVLQNAPHEGWLFLGICSYRKKVKRVDA
jgi:hypothetical protein